MAALMPFNWPCRGGMGTMRGMAAITAVSPPPTFTEPTMNTPLASAAPVSSGWADAFRVHAREHAFAALGLGVGLLAVVALLAQSLWQVLAGEAAAGVRYALIGGAAGFATTALGALPALVLRGIPQKLEDSLLGLAAGMMLAASAFSLLLPGLEAGAEILGSKPLGAGVVVFGMVLGVLLMPLLVWVAGMVALGAYANGGFGALLGDFLRGLAEGSLACWLVLAGPYLVLSLVRLLRRTLQGIATRA